MLTEGDQSSNIAMDIPHEEKNETQVETNQNASSEEQIVNTNTKVEPDSVCETDDITKTVSETVLRRSSRNVNSKSYKDDSDQSEENSDTEFDFNIEVKVEIDEDLEQNLFGTENNMLDDDSGLMGIAPEAILEDDGDEDSFTCNICWENFPLKTHLEKHVVAVHANDQGESRMQCTYVNCFRTFNKVSNLKKHEEVHKGTKLEVCPKCQCPFSCPKEYNIHLKMHTEAPEKCRFCDVDSTQVADIKHHEKVHTSKKAVCSLCDKIFSSSYNLKIHMRIHTGEKPYKCDICGDEFARQGSFQRHKYVHTGAKPYVCLVCNRSFSAYSYMKNHMNTHTKIKRHKCSYCDIYFSLKHHAKEHEKIHMGSMPYTCDICQRSFRRSYDMKLHMNSQHNGDPKRPEKKPKPEEENIESYFGGKIVLKKGEDVGDVENLGIVIENYTDEIRAKIMGTDKTKTESKEDQ